MKKFIYLTSVLVNMLALNIFSQDYTDLQDNTSIISFEVNLWKPLVFGGFTQVREWEHLGPKYNLNENLGMNSLESFDFGINVPVAAKHKINLILSRYFFQGHQLLTQNGYYNGTELQENTVASIDASRYIKVTLLDYFTLKKNNSDHLQFVFGISIDAIRFLVDAQYTQGTPRKETFEQFDKQIVPVPIVGLKWEKYFSNKTTFYTEVNGGAWPGIDTWYDEAGTIKIWQYDLDASCGICKKFGDIETALNFTFRLISIKGESNEDTNEILIHGFGPEFKISYSL